MSPLKPVRLRLTWSQRRAFVLTVVGFQVLVWGDALLNDGRLGGSGKTALAGLALIAMAALTWWVGTSATRRGILVHALPPMVIPWEEVHEIVVEHQLGIKTVVVHHGTTVRRRTRLSAPTTGPLGRDADFQEKVRILRCYWTAVRSASDAGTAA
ncbi:MAG: hypothetical protein ACRDWY_00765 [Actinomycetes bacterium]